MSIAKPFTFISGTYAKSAEVNADFDTAYSQINTNISNIAKNASDITNLSNTKANLNGNASQVFNVADPTASSHAVNKSYMMNAMKNTIGYISGLVVAKDSGNPETTIIVTEGCCYDSTKTILLEQNTSRTKEITNPGANAVYYVYIVGSDTSATTDIIFSLSSTTPTYPTGYNKHRLLASVETDGDKNITTINNLGERADNTGNWVYSNSGIIFDSETVGDYTVDLSSYLPDDNDVYEVLFNVYVGSSTNTVSKLYMKTILGETTEDLLFIAIKHGDSSNGGYNAVASIIPIQNRMLQLSIKDSRFSTMEFRALAYKKSK